eukprot:Ihof_evm8s52 gene=Ihof_evmTU8s52
MMDQPTEQSTVQSTDKTNEEKGDALTSVPSVNPPSSGTRFKFFRDLFNFNLAQHAPPSNQVPTMLSLFRTDPPLKDDEEERVRSLQRDYAVIKILSSTEMPNTRFMRLDRNRLALMWRERDRVFKFHNIILLEDALAMQLGQNSRTFSYFPFPKAKSQSFSLLMLAPEGPWTQLSTFDVICNSKEECDQWVDGIQVLSMHNSENKLNSSYRCLQLNLLSACYESISFSPKGGVLVPTVRSAISYAKTINDQYEKTLFYEASCKQKKSAHVSWGDFVDFYFQLVPYPPLNNLFCKYASGSTMTATELHMFLTTEQQEEEWTVSGCQTLIDKLMHDVAGVDKASELTLSGFNAFLLSGEMSWMDRKEKGTVCHDMSRPLSHYWINTSHNTYLLNDQYKGISHVEAYIYPLLVGCRCVELDLWDGPDHQPIITHGLTLCSTVPAYDVLVAIRNSAFQTSAYPVILSLENHLSHIQQTNFANMCHTVFGSMLLTERLDNRNEYPSPDELKFKIIIKAKVEKSIRCSCVPAGTSTHGNDGSSDDKNQAYDANNGMRSMSALLPSEGGAFGKFPSFSKRRQTLPELNLAEDAHTAAVPPPYSRRPPKAAAAARANDSVPPLRKTSTSSLKTASHSVVNQPTDGGDNSGTNEGSDNTRATGNTVMRGNMLNGSFIERLKAIEMRMTNVDELPPRLSKLSLSSNGKADEAPVEEEPVEEEFDFEIPESISVAPELVAITPYCQGYKFKSFNHAQVCASFLHLCSLVEKEAFQIIKKNSKDLVSLTTRQLVRIYPAGYRVESTNYNPHPIWCAGAQLVALNFQTPGRSMHLNTGFFRRNGNCGYVLKPQYMTATPITINPSVTQIKPAQVDIKLLCGTFINLQNKPISVRLELHGPLEQQKRELGTAVVKANLAEWYTVVRVNVDNPDLSLLYINAKENGRSIGQNCITACCLKPGYRNIPLYTRTGARINNSVLLVHITIAPPPPSPVGTPPDITEPVKAGYKNRAKFLGSNVRKLSSL